MRILLMSRHSRLGASSRIRSWQYVPGLKELGFDITVAPLLNEEYLRALYSGEGKQLRSVAKAYRQRVWHLLKSRRYDLLWIEKELFPWLPAWIEVLISRIGCPYIVDYDDATFHTYDLYSSRSLRALMGGKIDTVMRHAALVIAGNDYLAERARSVGARRVECIPSVVDLRRYPLYPKTADSCTTFGWIGTPITADQLQVIQPALAEVCKESQGRLALVGSGQIALADVPTEVHEWTESTEARHLRTFDIGIMPLIDEPFERGKCGYKLIQYMASGIPVVASPVGMNCQIVDEGTNGFLASTMAEWVYALSALRDDPDLRERMGAAGRRKVERQYCLQVTTPHLAKLLRSVNI